MSIRYQVVPYRVEGYDTERTEFGELVFQLKYRPDRTKIQPIAEVAANFIREKFAVDGHLILPYLKAILPIPPSDQNRDFQPVTEVAQEIGRLSKCAGTYRLSDQSKMDGTS